MHAWRIAFCLAGLLLGTMPSLAVTDVDLELVLAVDISYSMDADELAIQREGYISALTSAEVLSVIRSGVHGRIAVTYIEWAGSESQTIIADWRIIDSPESAAAFAGLIDEAPVRRAFRTSISSALSFAASQFDLNDMEGIRKVIDVSGDGPNNQGPLVTRVRDEIVAKSIVINGLPLVFKRPGHAVMDIADLSDYYTSCVIGGAGAFVIPVSDKGQFEEAIRTKLVLEIADAMPHVPALPTRLIPVQATTSEAWKCTAGERLWQQRYGN